MKKQISGALRLSALMTGLLLAWQVGAAEQPKELNLGTQSFPTFLSLSLYQIESNTRSAAVLGFVGAGGIGLIYAENMRLWNWDVVMFITLILVAVVMAMDAASAWLRRRYITGKPVPVYKAP